MKKAFVYYKNELCGVLLQEDEGYVFTYEDDYLNKPESKPISLLLPLNNKTYKSNILFPFFDGLIPEGYLLELAIRKWNLNYKDRMEILLKTAVDPIGAVSVKEASYDL